MNKNMVKRTWLNLIRKPSKAVVLFIIMFVIANLVLASLSISNAVSESTEYAKATLGGEVYLSADMEKMMGSMESMGEMNPGSMDKSSMMIDRPTTNVTMVEDLATSEYVKDYTYNISASFEPNNFSLVEQETSGFGGMGDRMPGNMITGINSYAFISEVESGMYEIVEGTYFDESTDDSVMISYELATLNELSVGSTMEFINQETYEIVSYSVIGIFTSTESGSENSIYMNIESASKLLGSTQYNDGDYAVNGVVYYLNSPEDMEEFIEEANSKYDLEEMSLVLDINNTAYEQMAGPIEQVGGFADTILWVVVIAAVLIIGLIINNSIKDRKYEMGVLMSLGATKKNITGQIFLELIIVATAGFILSIGTSQLIASGLSSSLLDSQLTMSEEASESNFGRPSMGGMSSMGRGDSNMTSDVDAIDEINVSVTISEYFLLFVIGYVISFVAMAIPALNIMKYEPKTILTGRQ